jgi:hypothetical protein
MRVSPGRIARVLLPLALATIAPATAQAVSIGDTNPLFFKGPDGYGFVPEDVEKAGLAPRFAADPEDGWLNAGKKSPKVDLAISVDLQQVHKDPNRKGKKPTAANPIIADSVWTVTNTTGEALEDVLLVFTLGNTSGKKSKKLVGLDGNLVDILAYSNDGVDYLFGVVQLGDLAAEGPGSSIDIDVRYIVGGRLARSGNHSVLPRFGTAAVTGATQVPEPATAALLALGLAALAAARPR